MQQDTAAQRDMIGASILEAGSPGHNAARMVCNLAVTVGELAIPCGIPLVNHESPKTAILAASLLARRVLVCDWNAQPSRGIAPGIATIDMMERATIEAYRYLAALEVLIKVSNPEFDMHHLAYVLEEIQ